MSQRLLNVWWEIHDNYRTDNPWQILKRKERKDQRIQSIIKCSICFLSGDRNMLPTCTDTYGLWGMRLLFLYFIAKDLESTSWEPRKHGYSERQVNIQEVEHQQPDMTQNKQLFFCCSETYKCCSRSNKKRVWMFGRRREWTAYYRRQT